MRAKAIFLHHAVCQPAGLESSAWRVGVGA